MQSKMLKLLELANDFHIDWPRHPKTITKIHNTRNSCYPTSKTNAKNVDAYDFRWLHPTSKTNPKYIKRENVSVFRVQNKYLITLNATKTFIAASPKQIYQKYIKRANDFHDFFLIF